MAAPSELSEVFDSDGFWVRRLTTLHGVSNWYPRKGSKKGTNLQAWEGAGTCLLKNADLALDKPHHDNTPS